MAITVRVHRISHPRAGLRAYQRRLNDFRPAWDRSASDLADEFGRGFASEGASLGRRWAQLREPYRRLKQRTHPGHPILTREGGLRNSMAERNAPGHVERFRRHGMEFGTSVAHARAHHFGRGVRARPFAVITVRMRRRVVGRVDEHLRGTP